MLQRLLRARLGAFGLVTVTALVLAAIFADLLAPHDPNRQIYTAILSPPSGEHLLGTDNLGRDVLSRIIHGSRVSLLVGLSSVAFASIVGSFIGLAAVTVYMIAYYRLLDWFQSQILAVLPMRKPP